MKSFLEEHRIFATDKDAEYLINRFNKNESRKISYVEFVQEMTPKSQKKY